VRAFKRGIRGIGIERQCQSVRANGADQRRTAHHHVADRSGRDAGVGNAAHLDGVRQQTLVEHIDVACARWVDDRTVGRGVAARLFRFARHASILRGTASRARRIPIEDHQRF
jgi:hypothetical protein